MKLKTIAFLFVFIIILFSNSVKGQHIKFSKTKNGLYYKFHIRNKMAIKAQLGDILIAELTIRTTDSIIFTNKGKPQKIFRVDTSNYKGDLNEGLRLMGKGEKATFIILTDSLKKIMHLPFNQKNKILYYDIKIKDIITKAEIEKEKEAKEEKQQILRDSAILKESKDLIKYLEINDIKSNPSATGLYYIEIIEGNGAKAEMAKRVSINYIGKLTNGKIFDTNIEKIAKEAGIFKKDYQYLPLIFSLGSGEVIPGWDEGICRMKVGGMSKLIIPSKLGYGERGSDSETIPPFSILIYEIDLINIEN